MGYIAFSLIKDLLLTGLVQNAKPVTFVYRCLATGSGQRSGYDSFRVRDIDYPFPLVIINFLLSSPCSAHLKHHLFFYAADFALVYRNDR
jgi:hypothetical protein